MPWIRPMFPQSLMSDYSLREFGRRNKSELKVRISKLCADLHAKHHKIPWDKLELNKMHAFKALNNFTLDRWKQVLDEAKNIVASNCAEFSDECYKVRDELLDIEKNESDDGKGTKELLLTISKEADSLGKQCSKASIEEHLVEMYEMQLTEMNKFAENRLVRLKQAIAEIVKKLKTVIELSADASDEYEKINPALHYCYKSIQTIIKEYIEVADKGLGTIDVEIVKSELEPLTKFNEDKSMFAFTMYDDDKERDIKVICSDETEEEDVKKHCVTILQAVRQLPSRWKS